jgi:hypothetical protein
LEGLPVDPTQKPNCAAKIKLFWGRSILVPAKKDIASVINLIGNGSIDRSKDVSIKESWLGTTTKEKAC